MNYLHYCFITTAVFDPVMTSSFDIGNYLCSSTYVYINLHIRTLKCTSKSNTQQKIGGSFFFDFMFICYMDMNKITVFCTINVCKMQWNIIYYLFNLPPKNTGKTEPFNRMNRIKHKGLLMLRTTSMPRSTYVKQARKGKGFSCTKYNKNCILTLCYRQQG